jgi:hypothetical protein
MRTPEEEEAAAELRAHGARHSLHFAAEEGMTDEVAAGIAAGQDVNACGKVILLRVFVDGWVGVGASLVYKSCMYISLYICIHIYIYIYHKPIYICKCIYIHTYNIYILQYIYV